MFNKISKLVGISLITLAVAGLSSDVNACNEGNESSWVALFDGSGSVKNSFDRVGDANWKARGDVVEADSGKGFLVTKAPYDDFKLKLEFYAESDSNSGIFFRCLSATEINDRDCYEANIFDSRPDQTYRTGGVTGVAPPNVHINSEGRWNTYEIHAVGSWIRVILNGVVTAHFQNNRLAKGRIGLQFAQGGIKFRKVMVMKLSGERRLKLLQDLASNHDSTIGGVWELTGFNLDDGQGNVTPWCAGAYGVIIYTEGYMSVAINCNSKPEKMVHYSGPYHLEEGDVIHHVQNFSDPNLKQLFRRKVEMVDSNHLDLVGPFGVGGKAVVSWRRR